MNLAVDIGNTLVKRAVFDGNQMVGLYKSKVDNVDFIADIFAKHPQIKRAILCSTNKGEQMMEEQIKSRVEYYLRFDASVKVPLQNRYHTPHTLGQDRLAAAVGANTLYPNENMLVVDFGTAITLDLVTNKGEFMGGNISPGVKTRFRALHEFTGYLPMCEISENVSLTAQTTKNAIESGVINGVEFEIEGYICHLSRKFKDLKIIFTGGDAEFFAKRLKNPIFASYDLVVFGLNRILEYNAH